MVLGFRGAWSVTLSRFMVLEGWINLHVHRNERINNHVPLYERSEFITIPIITQIM